MSISLQALAEQTQVSFIGDADCAIKDVASAHQAQAGDITFIRRGAFEKFLHTTAASAVIIPPELLDAWEGNALITKDPYLVYAKVASILHPQQAVTDIFVHPSASVADSVVLPDRVYIDAQAIVEDDVVFEDEVRIGAACFVGKGSQVGQASVLRPHVVLSANTVIGQRCLLHSGAVLGADGFGFAPDAEKWFKIPQIGNVLLGDDVEVGANTSIDCAAMGSTIIGSGVKLDNQIQIGHNVQIGDYTAMAACSCVAGSTKIGARCRIGGAVAISGHLQICDDVTITGMSMVINSIEQAGVYSSGVIAEENRKWRKNAIRYSQLDKMARQLKALEKALAELKRGKERGI